MTRPALDTLFAPRSVGIIGASPKPTSVGGRLLAHLEAHRYPGRVVLVNPRHDRIGHHRVAPSIAALDEIPDVAVVALPAAATVTAVEELADRGISNVVLVASGFDEAGGDGRALSERLRTLATQVNIVGPNSLGLWSVPARLVLAFGSEAQRDDLVAGPVAVVAQSGSLGGAVVRRLCDLGVGVRYWISSGNELGLSLADYLEHCLDEDPPVRVVAAYVEAVRDGARLIPLLDRARAAGVDIVVLHAGTGSHAQAMASSHTGRMASAPRRYGELFTQHGALVVHTVRDLVSATALLASTDRRIEAPGRVGVLGISGGMLALIADACEARHFTLPPLQPDTAERLRACLPAYATVDNPVDLTSAVLADDRSLPNCVGAMADDPAIDAVVVGLDNRGYRRVEEHATVFAAIARQTAKPVMLGLWDAPPSRSADVDLALLRAGVVVADDPAEVAAHLDALRTRPTATAPPPPARGAVPGPPRIRDWDGQTELAAVLGLTVPTTAVLDGGDQLSYETFEQVGVPAVVKALPCRVTHKTDRGLVVTGLTTYEDTAAAVKTIAAGAGPTVPVLVQAQVTGVEVLLAVTTDPDWGPVLTVGAGGALVELVDETFTVSVPCAAVDLRRRLAGLGRLHRLLAGYRGRPAADIDALIDVAVRLQHVAVAGGYDELELNPVLVGAQGRGVHMVDVLAR